MNLQQEKLVGNDTGSMWMYRNTCNKNLIDVCTHVCIYVYVCAYLQICAYVCASVHVCIRKCLLHVFMCVHMYRTVGIVLKSNGS